LAQARKAVASGFNMFMKSFVDAKVAGDDFTVLTNVVISAIDDDAATITVPIAADKTTKIYYGTSITNMAEKDDLAFRLMKLRLYSLVCPQILHIFLLDQMRQKERQAEQAFIHSQLWQHNNV